MQLELSQWTLEEKVGQLFICGFNGLIPDQGITALITEFHIGGIVYFRRNIESIGQVRELSRSLQASPRSHSEIPLFISIDQEGGMVSRLDHDGISRIPGNMALGAANDPVLTYEIAVLSAQEMLALGMNLNFAPCVDVNNNPANPVIGVRSFGENPEKVAVHGAAAIRGYQATGVCATAKHFPGHGDTAVDSHYGLASVPHDRNRLEQVELLPFRRAVEEGVDAIMTAHVMFPVFEPDAIPATLSRRVLTDLLREEMGYEGLIITDCLEMHAIAKQFGIAEGAVRAIEAGADIVLVSHTLPEQIGALEAVRDAVRSGRISEDRIDRSLERILSLKARRLARSESVAQVASASECTDAGSLTPTEESSSLLGRAAEQSVTLICDNGNLPLDRTQPVLVIWPELRYRTEVDEPSVHKYTLGDALRAAGYDAVVCTIGTEPEEAEIHEVINQSTRFKQIVAVTYTAEAAIPDGQRGLVKALNRVKNSRVIVVSTRNPYDIAAFPEVGTYLCLYENRQFSLDALVKVLAGNKSPQGILPVSLGTKYPAGFSKPPLDGSN
ncbi:beta-N-acetylhexosaminidase [Paenibacillus sp. GCM10012307]|uniref:Beta-N-acetylhexosaminidase n=1 Tax=Paenibacillus roseus TaxID=2798579 RepID=A0A934IYJ5_9BACL|nr:beta-N-acetylhexosaminidase [Paenibacillus roseus]MBJ6361592.1 beta-N-acetylhexosaminidase [Paenibacillus roseus]